MWPAGFDQPYIANEIDQLGCGYELLQIRAGPNVGRPCARNGVIPEGSSEALRAEFLKVFADMDSDLIRRLRTRVVEVRETILKDWATGGSHECMLELSRLGAKQNM